MPKQVNLRATPEWHALVAHHRTLATVPLCDLFAQDANRYANLSWQCDDLLVDASKNRITGDTLELLRDLARAADFDVWRRRLFAGEPVNVTEQQAALHTALRDRSGAPVQAGGQDVMPAVRRVLAQMRVFATAVRDGSWRGATGKRIRQVVHLGIGGSDLGPRLVASALVSPGTEPVAVAFVSNVDGADLAAVLVGLDPASTLFLVASKSFVTQETLCNAHTARGWLVERLGEAAVARHFAALSSNAEAVRAFGIDAANRFEFWDWVGGRYSLWSAIGLPIALALGMDIFEELLAGAFAMDSHFRTAPISHNLPLILALLDIWYSDFFGAETRAVVPYAARLRLLPAYLQQLELESNGKSVDRDGNAIDYPTAPIVWGAPGTDAQHSFFQALHQGTRLVPVDFIALAESGDGYPDHHRLLLANCFAQSAALMCGRARAQAQADLLAAGYPASEANRLAPHLVCAGNRPSTTILMRRLEPRTLGSLLALYEHKVFTEGVIWRICSFDQFGVELGKHLTARILPALEDEQHTPVTDASTHGLLQQVRQWTRPG